jgi:two-component system sensor histidine kinase KdpD
MADISKTKAQRLQVCVGSSPSSAGLIKAVAKLAAASGAEWLAVYVEDPKMLRLPEAQRLRAVENLRLAEQLGAETVTLRGRSIAEEIVNFARRRQVSAIYAGKPTRRPPWREFFTPSPLDELLRRNADIDVHVIAGEPAEPGATALPMQPKRLRWSDYEGGLLFLILATALCFLMYPYFDLANLIMVYLLAVLVTAVQCGRGPAILNSLLSVLTFDFCFVPPRWSFTVDDAKYIVTFVVMFLTAVIISHLTTLIRRQAEATRLHERQTAAMYALSRQLSSTRGVETILQVAVKTISEIFECQAVALLPDDQGKLHPVAGDFSAVFPKDLVKEMDTAQWAYKASQMAGWGTQNLPDSPVLYIPLHATNATIGLLALRPKDLKAENWLLPEQLRMSLIESLAKQVALALEVERLGS